MNDVFKKIAHKADKVLASMTQAEKDEVLERFRLTEKPLQEDIIISVMNHNGLLTEALVEAHTELDKFATLHHIDEWHEDNGTAVWWSDEPYPEYIGSPLCSSWPKDQNYKWWSYINVTKGGPKD